MDLTSLNLSQIRDVLRRKEVSAAELVRAHLVRIDRVDPDVGAYLTLSPERALEQAARVDRAIAAGDRWSLVPIATLSRAGRGDTSTP